MNTQDPQAPATPKAYDVTQCVLTIDGVPLPPAALATSFNYETPGYTRDVRRSPVPGDAYYPDEAPEGCFVVEGYGFDNALHLRWVSATGAPVPDVPPWGDEGEYRARLKPAASGADHYTVEGVYPDLRPADVAYFTAKGAL